MKQQNVLITLILLAMTTFAVKAEVSLSDDLIAYDGFSGNDFGWSNSWFEYSANNGNHEWSSDFNGSNYRYSRGEVTLEYVSNGISVKGGSDCVKASNTASGSESAALSRTVANFEGSSKNPLRETFYLSFLAQFSDDLNGGWDYVAVGAKQSGYDGGVALGAVNGKDKAGAAFAKDGSTIKYTNGKLPEANTTHLVVGKFTVNDWGSVTRIDIFIDPTSLTREKSSYSAFIQNSGNAKKNFYYYFQSIQLMSYFHDVAYFDEIRIGRTWNSVVSAIDNSASSVEPDKKVTVFEGPTGYWSEADKWSNGIPTEDVDTVIINGKCAVNNEVSAADLVVNGGGKLLVVEGGKINTTKPIVLKASKEAAAEYQQQNVVEDHVVEKQEYFYGGQWNFICVPEVMTADDLFPDLKLATSWDDSEADYWLLDYSQEQRASTADGMKDIYDGSYELTEGRGYIVWLDEDRLRTFKYTSAKHESYVSTTNSTVMTLSLNHSGWNLVGNPFSHSMSYEDVFDNCQHNQNYFTGAVYLWDGEGYKVWTKGVGDEEARVIAPMEAFFVKRTSNDPAAALFCMSDDGTYSQVETTAKPKFSQGDEVTNSLTVSVNQMKGALADYTYIRMDDRASLGLDESLDGLKLQTSSAYNDFIYTTDDNNVFAVNSVSLNADFIEVPLVVNLAQGMDSILLGFLINGDESYSYALVDDDEMTIQPVNHGDYLSISTDYEALIDGRFSIFVTRSLANETAIEGLSNQDNVLGEIYTNHKSIVVESLVSERLSVSVIGYNGVIYDNAVLGSKGKFVKDMNEGVYLVRLSDGNETVVKRVLLK